MVPHTRSGVEFSTCDVMSDAKKVKIILDSDFQVRNTPPTGHGVSISPNHSMR